MRLFEFLENIFKKWEEKQIFSVYIGEGTHPPIVLFEHEHSYLIISVINGGVDDEKIIYLYVDCCCILDVCV